MFVDWRERLKQELRHDESLALFAYPDPLTPMGKRLGAKGIRRCADTGYLPPEERSRVNEGNPWTIGYGHTASWVSYGSHINKQIAEALLEQDVQEALKDAEVLVGLQWRKLQGARKVVMANMAFNLGRDKLSKFHMTLNFVKRGLYDFAAVQMGKSLWAKQVRNRAARLIRQMDSGKYQELK